MGFLLFFGTIFAVVGIGNLATGYVIPGIVFVGLWLGAYLWAFLIYNNKPQSSAALPISTLSSSSLMDQRRQADVESRTIAALSRLAAIIGDTEDPREIIRRLETELQRNDQDAEISHALSQAYGESGDFRRAYESTETAIRLNPSEGRYHFTLSTLLMGACIESKFPGTTDTGITPDTFGIDYNRARAKAEFHAQETIRRGVISEFEDQARETLVNLRLLDQA